MRGVRHRNGGVGDLCEDRITCSASTRDGAYFFRYRLDQVQTPFSNISIRLVSEEQAEAGLKRGVSGSLVLSIAERHYVF